MKNIDDPYYNWINDKKIFVGNRKNSLSKRYYDTKDKTEELLLSFLKAINKKDKSGKNKYSKWVLED